VPRLDPGLDLPRHQHDHDAGVDLHARDDVVLEAGGGRALVPTGIAIAIPPGHAGFVLPRSGLALKHGVTCLNTPGLIDAQYRGELKVLLVNTDPAEPYAVRRGDRIAQLVIQPVERVDWVEVAELDSTTRDTFGFGSTGGFEGRGPGVAD
jgi:dUTP pyrophosphatase